LRESCRGWSASETNGPVDAGKVFDDAIAFHDKRIAGSEVTMTDHLAYAICALNEIPSQRAQGFHLMIVAEDGSQQPWPIIVIRWGRQVFGYLNRCPHDGVNLDWERNQFLDQNGTRLMCGKHGALFELGTGNCVEGPCKGQSLTPVALAVLDNDICVTGVTLVEDGEAASGRADA